MNGNYSKLIDEINQLRSKNIQLKAMEFYYIERKVGIYIYCIIKNRNC